MCKLEGREHDCTTLITPAHMQHTHTHAQYYNTIFLKTLTYCIHRGYVPTLNYYNWMLAHCQIFILTQSLNLEKAQTYPPKSEDRIKCLHFIRKILILVLTIKYTHSSHLGLRLRLPVKAAQQQWPLVVLLINNNTSEDNDIKSQQETGVIIKAVRAAFHLAASESCCCAGKLTIWEKILHSLQQV